MLNEIFRWVFRLLFHCEIGNLLNWPRDTVWICFFSGWTQKSLWLWREECFDRCQYRHGDDDDNVAQSETNFKLIISTHKPKYRRWNCRQTLFRLCRHKLLVWMDIAHTKSSRPKPSVALLRCITHHLLVSNSPANKLNWCDGKQQKSQLKRNEQKKGAILSTANIAKHTKSITHASLSFPSSISFASSFVVSCCACNMFSCTSTHQPTSFFLVIFRAVLEFVIQVKNLQVLFCRLLFWRTHFPHHAG